MVTVDPQLTASELLEVVRRSALYLFLGAAFTTVGLIAASWCVLRRKADALLIWFALAAVVYGSRMWIQSELLAILHPHSGLLYGLRSVINYLVPIPAFYFVATAGYVGSRGKPVAYAATVVFLGLVVATLIFGPLYTIHLINNVAIILGLIWLVVRSLTMRNASEDSIVIRRGLLVFAAVALYDNITGALRHSTNVEPWGFLALLGCLGYVAARRTLRRDAELGEIQKELEVARRIQLSILPAEFPASTSFRVAARYLPMTSVAGDFYDFLVGDDRQAGLLIADVSGHGVPAALIASMVKLAAVSQRDKVANPAEVLTAMNVALCGNAQQQFVTAAFVHLDSEKREIRYSAAGHPPMLLLRNGEVTAIEENGLLLAAFSFSTYSNTVSDLRPGDRLVLYTDGILEAADAKLEEFGQARLQALLRTSAGMTDTETADLITAAVQKWAVSQEDDLTVLVCDYAATG